MDGENLSRQVDEVEALTSIYGKEWCVVNEAQRIYCINVTDGQEKPTYVVGLEVKLPPEYPTAAPPIYKLSAPWLRGDEKLELGNLLEDTFFENIGENIIYMWVEKIREYLQEYADKKSEAVSPKTASPLRNPPRRVDQPECEEGDYEDEEEDEEDEDFIPDFIDRNEDIDTGPPPEHVPRPILHHGTDVIKDRKSTFVAHLAQVNHKEQVKMVLDELLEDRKVAAATHNIYAYRINLGDGKGCYLQWCEDDGEIHAGSRLLHLLQIMNAENVIVIVTRWYGGVHLGPDRFKHINNSARSILDKHGYVKKKEDKKKTKSSKRRSKEKS